MYHCTCTFKVLRFLKSCVVFLEENVNLNLIQKKEKSTKREVPLSIVMTSYRFIIGLILSSEHWHLLLFLFFIIFHLKQLS